MKRALCVVAVLFLGSACSGDDDDTPEPTWGCECSATCNGEPVWKTFDLCYPYDPSEDTSDIYSLEVQDECETGGDAHCECLKKSSDCTVQ